MFCHVSLILLFCSHHRGSRGCHEMSCFVMVRVSRLPIFGIALSSRPVSVLSAAPNAANTTNSGVCAAARNAANTTSSGTLFRAYRARVRAPVSAGAVRAPDCARARGRRRAHLSPLFPGDIFSRRRETEGDAAPRMPLPSARFILAWNVPMSSLFQEFLHFHEQTKILGPRASFPSEATRPPTPGRMGCPAGADRIGIGLDLCQDRPVSTFRRMRSGRVGGRECAAARRCKACPISRDAGPVRTPLETSVRSKTAGRGAASGCGRRKRSCASPASARSTRRA